MRFYDMLPFFLKSLDFIKVFKVVKVLSRFSQKISVFRDCGGKNLKMFKFSDSHFV